MKLSSRTSTKIGIALAAATILLSAVRTIAYFTAFDLTAGYFQSNVISSLLYILPALLSVAGVCLAYLRSPSLPGDTGKTPAEKRAAREKVKNEEQRTKALQKVGVAVPHSADPALQPPLPSKRSPLSLAADLLCAVSFVAVAIYDLSTATVSAADPSIFLLRALLALLASVSFVFPPRGHKLSYLAVLLQLTALAWCVSCVAMDYFDWNVAMNSPLKNYGQFSLCFCALYLSAHARAAMSDLFVRRHRMLAMPAAVFGISGGLSGLCAWSTGIFLASALPTLLISLAIGIHAVATVLPMFRGEVPTYCIPVSAARAEAPVAPTATENTEANALSQDTGPIDPEDSACS